MAHLSTDEAERTVRLLRFWALLLPALGLAAGLVLTGALTALQLDSLTAEVAELRQWREVDRVRIKTLELEVGELRKRVLLKQAGGK